MQPMGGFGGGPMGPGPGGPIGGGFGGPMLGGWGMGLGGGLLGTLLAGGLGYYVGRRRGQGNAQDASSQQYPQPATTDPSSQRMTQLKQLGQLRESGVVTEEEFQQEKQRILSGV